jgi:diguanylate cyclase (GGDEF)-like protein/PAS domain S-box-containing protein
MTPNATPAAPPHNRRFLAEWLLLVASLLFLAGFVGYSLHQEHEEIARRERERLTTQARVIHDNLGRQLDAINRALTNIRNELPYWNAQADGMAQATRRLGAFAEAMPGVRTLAILDATGTIRASNQPRIIGGNFREREYFQVPLRRPDASMLYVSPPFRTSLDTWIINIVKVVPGPNGEFAGIVSASLDPAEFTILLNSVRYAEDMRVGLNHGDGKVFMTAPPREDLAGINLDAPGSFYRLHVESGREENIFIGTMRSTGDARMAALRTIQPAGLRMDKPLMVAISRNLDAIHARWRREALIRLGLLGLFIMVGLPGLYFAQRGQRRAEREAAAAAAELRASRERLAVATDAAGIGVWELDLTSGRLLWDDWMHRLYGTSPATFGGKLDVWRERVHPDDIGRMTHEIENVLAADGVLDSEFRIVRADGETRHLKVYARVRDSADGRPERMTGVNYDITDEVSNAETLTRLNAQLREQSELLRTQAFLDGLTGVANRRRFDEALASEWRRCRRDAAPLSLLMIDIDHFKRYNDRYGHQAGDECLKAVSGTFQERLSRAYDLVARYGGEEFACILPDCDAAGALAKAEELRVAVESLNLTHEDSSAARIVTVSIGVATRVPDGDATPENLVAAADAALYAAKNAGRNRVAG